MSSLLSAQSKEAFFVHPLFLLNGQETRIISFYPFVSQRPEARREIFSLLFHAMFNRLIVAIINECLQKTLITYFEMNVNCSQLCDGSNHPNGISEYFWVLYKRRLVGKTLENEVLWCSTLMSVYFCFLFSSGSFLLNRNG